MRVWVFRFNNEEEYSYAAKELTELFKDCQDYKDKKIIICGINKGKEGEIEIYVSADDKADGVYSLSTIHTTKGTIKNVFTVVKSDCNEKVNVDLPDNCKISTWWEEDR